jgi:hypothetical protein
VGRWSERESGGGGERAEEGERVGRGIRIDSEREGGERER